VIGDTRSIVTSAVTTVLTSGVLIALVAVEFLWGFGMTAFEAFTPVKLSDVLESADQAAALLGPTNSVAWLVSAVGAASVPLLTKRVRTSTAAATMMLAQGLTVVAIALAYRPWGVVIAYVLTMGIHGAANPVHQGLLHRAAHDPGTRATVASANSMTAQAGGMVGGIALGVLADATNLPTAMVTGAVVIAAAAPLYLRVGRLNRA
jgi:predicted MFS family arabinose efflux permease